MAAFIMVDAMLVFLRHLKERFDSQRTKQYAEV